MNFIYFILGVLVYTNTCEHINMYHLIKLKNLGCHYYPFLFIIPPTLVRRANQSLVWLSFKILFFFTEVCFHRNINVYSSIIAYSCLKIILKLIFTFICVHWVCFHCWIGHYHIDTLQFFYILHTFRLFESWIFCHDAFLTEVRNSQ